MAQRRERGVGERKPGELPFACVAPEALGSEQCLNHGIPGDHVPDGHDVIDRPFMVGRTCHEREAGCRVDRVIQCDLAVAAADDRDHDEVLALRTQCFVIEPAAHRQVRDHEPCVRTGSRHERLRDFATLGFADVEHDRPLALVEARPVETQAVLRDRPAPVVEPSPDGIDADDIGAHLCQQESAEWRRDEGGRLNDAHVREDIVHGIETCNVDSRSALSCIGPPGSVPPPRSNNMEKNCVYLPKNENIVRDMLNLR